MENADQFLTHITQIANPNITLWFPLKFYLIFKSVYISERKTFFECKAKKTCAHPQSLTLPKQLLLVFGNVSVSSTKQEGFIFFLSTYRGII